MRPLFMLGIIRWKVTRKCVEAYVNPTWLLGPEAGPRILLFTQPGLSRDSPGAYRSFMIREG